MEQAQWATLCVACRAACRLVAALQRARYSDYLILRLYFWAVTHDRPMTWALNLTHYTRFFCPRKLPSISQLNRRIASDRFQGLLQHVYRLLSEIDVASTTTLYIDGKPLNVSRVSGDRDARPNNVGRGYKLHAVVSADRRIPVFSVMPLNKHEMPVARVLLKHLPFTPGTIVMADGNYDAHVLHKDIHARGGWLITKPKRGGARRRNRGERGHAVTRRQMGAARRHLIDLWERHPRLMHRVYRERICIERVFGHLSCTPGLLGPLPGFVRGLARVRRWVGAKICLYHARKSVMDNRV
jgi:hypothetical protein